MAKEFINPDTLPSWEQAFTQVVITHGATQTIYISGQVGVDKDKHLIGEGDLGAQAMQAFQNLKAALSAAGATVADVVKLNVYVKDYKTTDAALINEALRKHFPQKGRGGAKQFAEQLLPTHTDILGTLRDAVKQKRHVLARDSQVTVRK